MLGFVQDIALRDCPRFRTVLYGIIGATMPRTTLRPARRRAAIDEPARSTLTPETWIGAATEVLIDQGIDAVRVDVLAKTLAVTRGSFYWHFKDRQALLEEAMIVWEELETDRIEQMMATIADPVERMRFNFRIALGDVNEPIPNLEPAIWAHPGEPVVAAAIRRVSVRRIDILTRGFADLGFPPVTARHQAILTYATYLGWLQLRRSAADHVPEVNPDVPAGEAFVRHLMEQLIDPAGFEMSESVELDVR